MIDTEFTVIAATHYVTIVTLCFHDVVIITTIVTTNLILYLGLVQLGSAPFKSAHWQTWLCQLVDQISLAMLVLGKKKGKEKNPNRAAKKKKKHVEPPYPLQMDHAGPVCGPVQPVNWTAWTGQIKRI